MNMVQNLKQLSFIYLIRSLLEIFHGISQREKPHKRRPKASASTTGLQLLNGLQLGPPKRCRIPEPSSANISTSRIRGDHLIVCFDKCWMREEISGSLEASTVKRDG